MSKLVAHVKKIEHIDSLHIVTFCFGETELKMMSLELPDDVSVDKRVHLNIKPMSVAVAKEFSGKLSYPNQIKARITTIKAGFLLCNVKLLADDNYFESIITNESYKAMRLKINEEVTMLIKANDISIVKVLS